METDNTFDNVEQLEKEILGTPETETIGKPSNVEKKERTPFSVKYVYIAALLTPVIALLATFLTIPKKAKQQVKNKRYMIAGGVIVAVWIVLGVAVYFKRDLLNYGFSV